MFRRNQPASIPFVLRSLATGADVAGLSVSGTRILDNGAPAAVSGTIADLGSGRYRFDGNAADFNGSVVCLHFTATGAMSRDFVVKTTVANPDSSADFGISNLDVSVGSRLATAGYTSPDNASVAAIKARTDLLPAAWPANFSSLAINVGGQVTAGTVADKAGYALTAGERSAIRIELDGNSTRLSNLDATVSSRLAASGYTAPDNAVIAAIYSAVDTEVAAIKAKTDLLPANWPSNFPSLIIDANGRIQIQQGTGVGQLNASAGSLRMAPDGLDAIAIEAGLNARQAISEVLASTCGQLSIAGDVVTLRNPSGTAPRATVTTDPNGQRLSVVLNPPV